MPRTHQDAQTLNLTRFPDYAAVRSEIETFLEARQSSSNSDAMDIGCLNGQKGVCRTCGQRGHWAAECPKRVKKGQGGKGDDGKGQGKKGKSGKGKTGDGKEKGKGGKWQERKAFERYCNHCWKWGHMEKDCFTLARSKGKGGKDKKVLAVSMKLRQVDQKILQFVDLVCARLKTCVATGNGTLVAK